MDTEVEFSGILYNIFVSPSNNETADMVELFGAGASKSTIRQSVPVDALIVFMPYPSFREILSVATSPSSVMAITL